MDGDRDSRSRADRPADAPVVNYHGPQPQPLSQRASGLAVTSMVLSLLCFPCFTGWVISELRSRLGLALPPGILFVAAAAAPIGVVALAIAALTQIRLSRGRLKGKDYAYFAISFCVLWLLMLSCLWEAMRKFRLGPGD